MAQRNIVWDDSEFTQVLFHLGSLPKKASQDLRMRAIEIAEGPMKKIYTGAIKETVSEPLAEPLIKSMRARRDRIPVLAIGDNRKKKYSGGASTNMVRYGTIIGPYFSRGRRVNWPKNAVKGQWIKLGDERAYTPILNEWMEEVKEICLDWERGKYV
jgi:hypothetical protein